MARQRLNLPRTPRGERRWQAQLDSLRRTTTHSGFTVAWNEGQTWPVDQAVRMIERTRHRLRRAGVRGLPRGPRASTEAHPAGLTSKEVTVLTLLASGLRNKEIAERVNRSTRTVDHHA